MSSLVPLVSATLAGSLGLNAPTAPTASGGAYADRDPDDRDEHGSGPALPPVTRSLGAGPHYRLIGGRLWEQTSQGNRYATPEYKRKGVKPMKTLISALALTVALAFTGSAFAGDVTTAKNQADCEKAGGTWDTSTKLCSEKKM